MKRILILVLPLLFLSCNDGELQIEALDFDAASVEFCVTASDDKLTNTFFFKIQGDEALLLTMGTGQFKNTTSLDGSITSNLSAGANPKLIYRLFTGTVNKGYFCDAIPAAEPGVVKENSASGGTVTVTTSVSKVGKSNKTYTHNMAINDLSLTNELGERLTDTSTLDYGNFTTDTQNSGSLDVPFSNYTSIDWTACETPPAVGNIRLYKVLNDESITLEIPESLIANEATGEAPRSALLEGTVRFKNTVFNALATQEFFCGTALPEAITAWDFVSDSGSITVTTVENAPNAQGQLNYTHTLSLTDLVLVLKGNGDNVADIVLEAIPTVSLGTYTTIAP